MTIQIVPCDVFTTMGVASTLWCNAETKTVFNTKMANSQHSSSSKFGQLSLTQRIPAGSCGNIVIIVKMFVLALLFVYQERLLLFSYKTRGMQVWRQLLFVYQERLLLFSYKTRGVQVWRQLKGSEPEWSNPQMLS